MMRFLPVGRLLVALSGLALAACDLLIPPLHRAVAPNQAEAPPDGPERACTEVCAARASRCTARECLRGCNLVLDRLVEHEGTHVVACVAQAEGPCGDRAWSACAARVGPHADGGPPPPASRDPIDDEP